MFPTLFPTKTGKIVTSKDIIVAGNFMLNFTKGDNILWTGTGIKRMSIDEACDYIIMQTAEAGESLNLLKLQKLLYYVQAWHLAFYGKAMFSGKFQAWIHGPVNRYIYDRFVTTKSLYSDVDESDISGEFDPERLSRKERQHIDTILEAYAGFTGSQLEEMTHSEKPWKLARQGCRPSQRCEVEIDQRIMQEYYSSRLKKKSA
jgi:uncharacterized phage-associated protein